MSFYENPFTIGVTSSFDDLRAAVSVGGVKGLKLSECDRALCERIFRTARSGSTEEETAVDAVLERLDPDLFSAAP